MEVVDLKVSSKDDFFELSDLIPGQKMGPLQFEFENGILKLKNQSVAPSRDDASMIEFARQALVQEGASLIKSLNDTNCDKRIVDFVYKVDACIIKNVNIINLGMLNITCSNLIKSSYDELSNVASAKFIGYNSSLSIYVAQFPEWRRFVENAADIEISEQDYRAVYEVGRSFIDPLKKASGLVDPEVPRSLELLFEAFHSPSVSLKRQVFSIIRSLENLIAKIFSEFALTYEAFSDGARSGLKKTTSILVASGLLLTVAGLATQLSPTAERVLHSGWMAKAPSLIKDAIDQMNS